MVTLRQAAEQALEALEGWANHGMWVWPESALDQAKRNTRAAIPALRTALAEQQKPVAWMTHESKNRLRNGGNSKGSVPVHKNPSHTSCIPLYTAPQPRREVELTDEDIDRALDAANVPELPAGYESVELEIARAVIEAYKAKQEQT